MINRVKYFLYYLWNLDYRKFINQFNHARKDSQRSGISIVMDVVGCSFQYNISPLEYFYFGFYKNSDSNFRSSFAGTGYMYEYQRKMNPQAFRDVLEDKGKFLSTYAPFIKHSFLLKDEIDRNEKLRKNFLKNYSGKIVLKNTKGQCGKGVEIVNTSDFDEKGLLRHLESTGNNMIEEFVKQHPSLQKLSPSGLNTLRIVTQINGNGEVEILGVRLRISVDSHVDNLAAGNIAAPVDLQTGEIAGPGVFSDILKAPVSEHPVTKESLIGFQIPFFDESIELVKKAALFRPENRSVGWDVAITSKGPDLIEGNHNWCKLLWQLPVQAGLKTELEKYL